MCFSAAASFAAAGALVPMGVYCARAAARRVPRYWGFAVIPFAFAAQQAAEGVVWLGLTHGKPEWVPAAAGVYLFFALAWWPVWFPLAAACAAPPGVTRRLLAAVALAGTGWFALAYLPVLTGPDGLTAEVAHHSIRYPHADDVVVGGAARWPVTLLYGLFAGGPLLLLGRRDLVPPVVLGVVCFAAAGLAYAHAYTSVWCFFAALLSAYCVYFFATAAPDGTVAGVCDPGPAS